jgi:hypothetical protein
MALATALRQDRPSLPTLVEALVVTGTTVDQWRTRVRDGTAGTSSTRRRRLRRLFPSGKDPICPQCSATQPYRNGRATTVAGEQEFICKRCGTRYTQSQVLFSFDPHPTYRGVLAERNAKRLARCRDAVAAVVAGWPTRVRLTRTAVFAQAGVPRSIAYTTERAGLVQILVAARSRSAAAHAPGLASIQLRAQRRRAERYDGRE